MAPSERRGAVDAAAFLDRWVTAANSGDWDSVAGMLGAEVTLHDPMATEPVVGPGPVLARIKAQYEPFPDGSIEMLDAPFVSVEGGEIAYRWRFTGTQSRPVEPPGFAPTDRFVRVEGCSFLRVSEGQARRIVLYFDTTDVARQLLAAPRAGSPLERGMVLAQRARVRLRRAVHRTA